MTNFTKKVIAPLALLATLFAAQTSKAQDYYTQNKANESAEEKNIRLGLSVNPNIGWFRYNDEDYKSGTKMGFSYGLIADIGFARNYYFSTGMLVNSIASSMTYEGGTETGDQFTNRERIRLQYVDIPLTVKLKSEANDMGRFYGQFGFTAGLKVSGKEKITGSTKNSSIDKDDLFRLGLQLGGGAEWKLNDNLALLTGLTFNNGFTRAINNDGKPKTSFIALNLGLMF